MAQCEGKVDEKGQATVVRNGDLPEHQILSEDGSASAQIPKICSRTIEAVALRPPPVPPYDR